MTGRLDEQTHGLLGVVVILRVALIVWTTAVVVVDITGITSIHASRAVVLLGVLAAWTSSFAWLLRRRPGVVASNGFTVADVVVSALAAASDPFVYPGQHPQSFPSAWPLSGAVAAGIVAGPRAGTLAGSVIGTVGGVSTAVLSDGGLSGRLLGSLGTIVLLSVAGLLAGVLSDRMRHAELSRARAQIREETARRLHDGVLQTLAVIQRRSDDPELVRLAREQEADLRSFISVPAPAEDPSGRGATTSSATAVSDSLRRALADQQRRFGLRTELVVVDEPADVPVRTVEAVTGAVTEAVTNASKHGGASSVVVFVDHEDGFLRCEVRDDGSGFDTGLVTEGTGMTRSIRGRIDEVHGRVDITSKPDKGVTVRMTVPLDRSAEGRRR